MKNSTLLQLQRRPFGWTFDIPETFSNFEFEELDYFYWHKLIQSNSKWAFYAGALYIVTIFGLQHYMKNKRALELKRLLFLWNFFLGIFSIIGFWRTAPEFVYVISKPGGFFNSICVKSGTNVPLVFWTIVFAFSKFLELGDTLFIVLRKRPLIFLQWYHHLVTMIVVWVVAPLVEPIVRWYVVLNYGVHSLMYPYFALRAGGVKVPHSFANLITTLQLTQMVVGFGVNVGSMLIQKSGYECARYDSSIKAFAILYGSFLILFGKLFYDSVLKSGRSRRKEKIL
ncbi:unnamed protein product [Orchesella dallaii]|uniref:Elongation of very long chain fatty acids protein n=1 Tax=Orchesella dallaii TaxID=48710 RepID=A0ABP1S884_9HEXA